MKLWRSTSLEQQLFMDQSMWLISSLRRSLNVLHSPNIPTFAKWYEIQISVDLFVSYSYSNSGRVSSAQKHFWEHTSWTAFNFPGSCKTPQQQKRYHSETFRMPYGSRVPSVPTCLSSEGCNSFVDYKRFSFVIKIVNCDEFWDTLFAMIQAIYPIYCILRLSDMKLGGMDKMKYYVCQTDRLLEDGMRNLMKKWSHPRMPTMDFSFCCLSKQDKDFFIR